MVSVCGGFLWACFWSVGGNWKTYHLWGEHWNLREKGHVQKQGSEAVAFFALVFYFIF